jgi:hypothetical protein
MPSLLEKYKQYQGVLQSFNSLLARLEEKQKTIAPFLAQDKEYFARNDSLRLASVPAGEKLESIKKKIMDAHANLQKESDPLSPQTIKLKEDLNKLQNDESMQEQKVQEIDNDLKALKNTITWIEQPFTMSYVADLDISKFNGYIEVLNEAVKLKAAMITLQVELGLLRNTSDAADVKEATLWSKENIAPLTEIVLRKSEELMTRYHYGLNKAYQTAATNALSYLGGEKYKTGFESKKYNLSDLEGFVAERKIKQDGYRAMLPAYVVGIIPADAHIKGDKSMGFIGRTNTGKKIKEIAEFFNEPFSNNRNESIEKINKLFGDVGVTLSEAKVSEIYEQAILAQAGDVKLEATNKLFGR